MCGFFLDCIFSDPGSSTPPFVPEGVYGASVSDRPQPAVSRVRILLAFGVCEGLQRRHGPAQESVAFDLAGDFFWTAGHDDLGDAITSVFGSFPGNLSL